MLLDVRMNECRFGIAPIRLWLRSALEECGSTEMAAVGGGAGGG